MSSSLSGRCFTVRSIGLSTVAPAAFFWSWSAVGMPWLRPTTTVLSARPAAMIHMPGRRAFTKQNARSRAYDAINSAKPRSSIRSVGKSTKATITWSATPRTSIHHERRGARHRRWGPPGVRRTIARQRPAARAANHITATVSTSAARLAEGPPGRGRPAPLTISAWPRCATRWTGRSPG